MSATFATFARPAPPPSLLPPPLLPPRAILVRVVNIFGCSPVDCTGAGIVVPRHDGDGRSSSGGAGLGCPSPVEPGLGDSRSDGVGRFSPGVDRISASWETLGCASTNSGGRSVSGACFFSACGKVPGDSRSNSGGRPVVFGEVSGDARSNCRGCSSTCGKDLATLALTAVCRIGVEKVLGGSNSDDRRPPGARRPRSIYCDGPSAFCSVLDGSRSRSRGCTPVGFGKGLRHNGQRRRPLASQPQSEVGMSSLVRRLAATAALLRRLVTLAPGWDLSARGPVATIAGQFPLLLPLRQRGSDATPLPAMSSVLRPRVVTQR